MVSPPLSSLSSRSPVPGSSPTVQSCGAEDVYTNNLTHVYWGMYYITPSRLSSSSFTVPLLSDVGLQLVMREPTKTLWEEAMVIYKPFTDQMWALVGSTLALVALVMWFVDHGGKVEPAMKLAERFPDLYGKYGSEIRNGFLTMKRFGAEMPSYAIDTIISQLKTKTAFVPKARRSRVLNLAYATFVMVYAAPTTPQLLCGAVSFVALLPLYWRSQLSRLHSCAVAGDHDPLWSEADCQSDCRCSEPSSQGDP